MAAAGAFIQHGVPMQEITSFQLRFIPEYTAHLL